jgi:hypothetical protein
MLLGIVSLRAGTKLHYDGESMRITTTMPPGRAGDTGSREAFTDYNELLTRQYRAGWGLL